jgi:glucose/arabinose dehydrogenase
LYGSDGAGKVFVIPRPGAKPVLLSSGFQSAAGLGLATGGRQELSNLFTFFASNYPQYELVINNDVAMQKGVSIKKAMDNLNILIGSTYEQGFIRFGQFYKGYVQGSPAYRRFPEDLDNLFIKNDRGEMVPYSAFMTIKKQQGLNEINRKAILVADTKAGTITPLPTSVTGQEVDERPLPLKAAVAFPRLKWTGWEPISESGKMTALRPIVLTHAGDRSNRVFVATQRGVIHVFPNDQQATKTRIFLDIHERVFYDDNENEQGFLGLVFHPNYKKNGEFFVFYTLKKSKTINVLSRFRVRRDDPNRADPDSEEELLRISRPFWNHDGGTICFGPDGYLYVALGDGGAANDPHGNGQNLKTLLGKILRLNVDQKSKGLNYSIPKDNPFVGRMDARPEIWAYGLRNVWRMAFDRKSNVLWAADVGQNLYEEIDLIVRGGNYGWNRREALHPFGARGSDVNKALIDPIWEYHHDIGKSITGGSVYRGQRLPELQGAYVYADYVSTKIWALRYDDNKRRVVANRPIHDPNVPVMSFGEDEKGELYFLTYTNTGQGIYWFVKD